MADKRAPGGGTAMRKTPPVEGATWGGASATAGRTRGSQGATIKQQLTYPKGVAKSRSPGGAKLVPVARRP